jgi:hypothetical protein
VSDISEGHAAALLGLARKSGDSNRIQEAVDLIESLKIKHAPEPNRHPRFNRQTGEILPDDWGGLL